MPRGIISPRGQFCSGLGAGEKLLPGGKRKAQMGSTVIFRVTDQDRIDLQSDLDATAPAVRTCRTFHPNVTFGVYLDDLWSCT